MSDALIYRIRNILNNHIYIGSTVNLKRRRWTHLGKLRGNKHHSPILQNSWNKYGELVFKKEYYKTHSAWNKGMNKGKV